MWIAPLLEIYSYNTKLCLKPPLFGKRTTPAVFPVAVFKLS